LFFTDNLSSDVQSPDLFKYYSFNYYKALAEHFHIERKTLSTHIDDKINDVIGIAAEAGIDVNGVCTPKPTGDLTPFEIRDQAGDNMILMGGISSAMLLSPMSEKKIISHVTEWLDLKKINSGLIQSASDQVPPVTEYKRIKLVCDIVEEFGWY